MKYCSPFLYEGNQLFLFVTLKKVRFEDHNTEKSFVIRIPEKSNSFFKELREMVDVQQNFFNL